MFLFQNKGVCGFFGFYKFADNYFILRYDIFIPVITKNAPATPIRELMRTIASVSLFAPNKKYFTRSQFVYISVFSDDFAAVLC